MAYTTQAVCPECGRLHVSDKGYDGKCCSCGHDESKHEQCEACRAWDVLNSDGLCRTCSLRWKDNGGCYER